MPRSAGARRARPAVAAASLASFARISKSEACLRPQGQKKPPLGPGKRKRLHLDEGPDPGPPSSATACLPQGQACRELALAASSKRPCRRPERGASAAAKQGPEPVAKPGPDPVAKPGPEPVAKHGPEALPPMLADLARLHRAFLATVTLRAAHLAPGTPIDLRNILPDLSRTWGRRQVDLDDIRRCIALQSACCPQPPFTLSQYGAGRICLDIQPQHEGLPAINLERLCRRFDDHLATLGSDQTGLETADMRRHLASLSLSDLPQATVNKVGSDCRASPLLAKGQRALLQLKQASPLGEASRTVKKAPHSQDALAKQEASSLSLLDRLRLKELAKTKEPQAPSRAQLQRRAALNRVTDVAATISMLSLSTRFPSPRQAFTMAKVSEKLQDSLPVPISKEEGIACLRVIATEVAPEWLQIVAVGGRENVVLQRNGQPVDRVLRERVEQLLNQN